jgi:alpha 1,2-mannosyltransferase
MARVMGHRAPSPRTITAAAILLILYLTFFDNAISSFLLPSSPNQSGIGRIPKDQTNPLRSQQLVHFWQEYVHVLLQAKPKLPPLKLTSNADTGKLERAQLVDIKDEGVRKMKESHSEMVGAVKYLGKHLPYEADTQGIVMTAGGKYFGVAIASIRMLRRTGSKLPVEVYLDSWKDYDIETCERIFPELNARCFVLAEILQTTPEVGALQRFQFKAFSILFSSFEDVLFLDADAFPAHKPDVLLEVEPYKSTGLVTFPDFWWSTSSEYFYDIAGIPVPPLLERKSSESGILLYSKRLHGSSLLLATYYNYYGPDYYYPLLSQGAMGEGDKETFLHAALALDLPFYSVKTPVTVMGAWINGTFFSAGMKQGDPVEDYSLQQMMAKDPSLPQPTSQDDNKEHPELFARPLFIHNNIVKLDVRHLFEDPARWRNETGHLITLWGKKDDMVHEFGFDIEKVLWEELTTAACEIGDEECGKCKYYIDRVYPGEIEVEIVYSDDD